eukprot:s3852_g9.t1
MGAEPQISHWRQLLEQARLEKSLVPDIEDAVDDGLPAAWGGSALRIFRQRSILQEEWLHSFMPQSRSSPSEFRAARMRIRRAGNGCRRSWPSDHQKELGVPSWPTNQAEGMHRLARPRNARKNS